MNKRHLYKLEFVKNTNNQVIEILRTDKNYGVQGYVYSDGRIKKSYHPYSIPNYIVEECLKMFKNTHKT